MDEAFFLLNEGEQVIKKGMPYNLEITKVHRRLAELHFASKNFEKHPITR